MEPIEELRPSLVIACIVTLFLIAVLSYSLYKAFKLSNSTPLDYLGREGYDHSRESREAFAELSYPWMRVETLESVRSLYHKIDVIDTKREELGKCLVMNDEIALCTGEEVKYHELITHYGIQYLPLVGPKRVLIVGGGDCMVLREIMKYDSIQRVDVLELDDMVTRVCEKHFQSNHVDRMPGNPKVHWAYGNVRKSLQKLAFEMNAKKEKYDYIVVDTTETTDHNAETDTTAFFEDLRNLLEPATGVLVKNGDGCETIMRKTFAHTMEYGYDSKTHNARYSFVLGAPFDFKTKIVTTGAWFALNVKTSFYTPDNHFDYLKWTDTYKQTLLERITTVMPAISQVTDTPQYKQPVEVR